MKILNKVVFVSILTLGLTGCYRKTLLFEAETLSVTKKDSAEKALKVGKEVEVKWCMKEDPVYTKGGHSAVGLAEQGIYLAQGKGEKADFILEARVFTDTDGCVIVEGKRAKISKK